MPTSTRSDLDYYMVELLGPTIQPVKKPAVANRSVITASFLDITISSNDFTLKVNVTAFDKCGQSSPQPLTIACGEVHISYKEWD